MKTIVSSLLLLLVTFSYGNLFANGLENKDSSVSVTTNPLYTIFIPLWFNVDVEFKLSEKNTISVILGGGKLISYETMTDSFLALSDGEESDPDFYTVGIGTQFRRYLFSKNMTGFNVGGEFSVFNFILTDSSGKEFDLMLRISPLVGYKYVFHFGLTLELQVGSSLALAHINLYNDRDGNSEIEHYLMPYFRTGVGWTF